MQNFDGAALDSDIVLKFAAYKLVDCLVVALSPLGSLCALGLTHIIASKQLARSRTVQDKEGASRELATLLQQLSRLEPRPDEIDLSADIEAIAQSNGLPIDRGEAQLLAIVLLRRLPALATGDKRAIASIDALLDALKRRQELSHRLICLEQLLLAAISGKGIPYVRSRVCAEPNVDKTASICFGCGRPAFDLDEAKEGLTSYIGDIRSQSAGNLHDGDGDSGFA